MTDVRRTTTQSSNASREVRLPVAQGSDPPRVRKSKAGRRRAIVLAAVQLLMIAHIVLWWLSGKFDWWGGTTISPIEPSESMEFVKHGVINAGLIFFAIALLSTVLLGRWFCGWGCHIVMLQDGCGWLLRKMGLRPKPFRSRLLIYATLLLALYMFVWPAAYRFALVPFDGWLAASYGPGHWSVQTLRSSFGFFNIETAPANLAAWTAHTQLTTNEFWRTFPGVLLAIPFLLICGFATVYFLGMKGYCTYACPYGGFFAPLDKYAVGRIRVTDDCQQTGHCTSVCSSNVRVHDEVREFGMVVDPGCMKCLDCVSVCPNDALYFGLGKPAKLKGSPRNTRPKTNFDLTLLEEFALAGVYAMTLFAFRGALSLPLLFAAGVAAIVTFLIWKLWRLVPDANVSFHRFRLKHNGQLRGPGVLFAACVLLVLVLVGYSGAVNATHYVGSWHWRRVDLHASQQAPLLPGPVSDDDMHHADRALAMFRVSDRIAHYGRIATEHVQQDIEFKRAQLLWKMNKFAQAEDVLKHSIERFGRSQDACRMLPMIIRAQHVPRTNNRNLEAITYYEDVLSEEIDYWLMLEDFMNWMIQIGNRNALQEMIKLCEARMVKDPDDLPTLRWYSMTLIEQGRFAEAESVIRDTIDIDPTSPGAYFNLAGVLNAQGRLDEALSEALKADHILPNNPSVLEFIASILEKLQRTDEAAEYYQRAYEALHRLQSAETTEHN